MRVLRRPRFVDDLSEGYAYLSEVSPASADRLLDAVEALIELLGVFPEIGRPRDELRAGVRSFRIRRFSDVLFYRLAEGELVLLRLVHGAMDVNPSYVSK